MNSFGITNRLVDEALCGIKEEFVHEMLITGRLSRKMLRRFVAVAVPVAAAAAVDAAVLLWLLEGQLWVPRVPAQR